MIPAISLFSFLLSLWVMALVPEVRGLHLWFVTVASLGTLVVSGSYTASVQSKVLKGVRDVSYR